MAKIIILKGGDGSGNFGHAGRPGLVGGSAPKDFSLLPYAVATKRAIYGVGVKNQTADYNELYPDAHITEEQYVSRVEANMQRILAGCDVSVRLTQANLLEVVEDGEYKSVFESKRSSAAVYNTRKTTYLKHRRECELDFFDIDAKQKTGRPVYGYISSKGNVRKGAYWLDQYGDVAIVLNDNVRERTTFTDADSLDNAHVEMVWIPKDAGDETVYDPISDGFVNKNRVVFTRAFPSYIDDPKIYSSIWMTTGSNLLSAYDDNASGFYPDGGTYWEAQVHGGFTLSDIKEVVFTKSEPLPELTRQLDAKGIAWRVE